MISARRLRMTRSVSFVPGGPVVVDNFNRADAATLGTSSGGQAWSSTNMRIVSNQAGPAAGLAPAGTAGGCAVDATKADVDVTVTVATLQISGGLGVLCRMNAAATQGYGWNPESGLAYRWDAGAYASGSIITKLSGMSGTTSSGALLRMTAIGSTFTMYIDGTQVGTFTDATYAGNTHVGLRVAGSIDGLNTSRYDNFQVL